MIGAAFTGASYKIGRGHKLEPLVKRVAYLFCVRCGLVALKNEASRKALSKPCDAEQE